MPLFVSSTPSTKTHMKKEEEVKELILSVESISPKIKNTNRIKDSPVQGTEKKNILDSKSKPSDKLKSKTNDKSKSKPTDNILDVNAINNDKKIISELTNNLNIFDEEKNKVHEEFLQKENTKEENLKEKPKQENISAPSKVSENFTEYFLHKLSISKYPYEHILLCDKLRYKDILDYIPYMVDIMLINSSDAIYNLLLYRGRNMQIRIILFCYLKSILSYIEDVNKAAMCYYLCCDLYEIEIYQKRRNVEILAIRIKANNNKVNNRTYTRTYNETNKKRRHIKMRTRAFYFMHNKLPNFKGIFLSFFRALTFYDEEISADIEKITPIYNKKRNLRNITSKSTLYFKDNLKFYYDLMKISDKLSELPKSMKQRLLIVSVEMHNMNHPQKYVNLCYHQNDLIIKGNQQKYINKLHVTSSLALDSKANGPFMVNGVLITNSLRWKNDPNKVSNRMLLDKANTLVYQFETIKDINDINDLNGIRSNILIAIEQLMLERIIEKEMNSKNVSYENIKRESIEDLRVNANVNVQKELTKEENVKEDETQDVQKETQIISQEETQNLNSPNNLRDKENLLTAPKPTTLPRNYLQKPDANKISFIVKNGSIMKEEYLAIRIITQIKNIFIKYNIPIYLRNYKIIIITEDSGIVETVVNSISIHKIKEKYNTLKEYFIQISNNMRITKNLPIDNEKIEEELKRNFLNSLVGYCLIQYLLSLKDRHNANILIDEKGHMVHIDFGYILGKYPGFYGVESAPFKFSMEYLEMVGMEEFKKLFIDGFKCLYDNRHILPIEIIDKLDISEENIEVYCNQLINKSVGNYLTVLYDQFQYLQNGYYR